MGSGDIADLIDRGHLEKVAPSAANADRLIGEANRHLRSAELLAGEDPAGAYDLLYTAARKSMAAALAVQGLRATSAGGHVAVEQAIAAQLGGAGGVVRPFGRLRRTRNDADYPRLDTPELAGEDVTDDLPKARAIVEAMARLIEHLEPW